MAVQIVAKAGTTDGAHLYACMEVVLAPSPRLQQLADNRELVLGELIAVPYTAAGEFRSSTLPGLEAITPVPAEGGSGPTLDQVRAAAASYGHVLIEASDFTSYQSEMENLRQQLSDSREELAVQVGLVELCSSQLAEAKQQLALAEAKLLAAPETGAAGDSPAGDPTEAAAPPEDNIDPKPKRK